MMKMMFVRVPMLKAYFALLLSTLIVSVAVVESKKLVIFAGPHETSGKQVNDWFSKYAANDGTGVLEGWAWPTFENMDTSNKTNSDHDRRHMFDLTVSEQDDSIIQDILLSAIRFAWDTSENGVIIGSLLYDRVGPTPETGYDALKAITRIVQTVKVDPVDVYVVLTYRKPRVEHFGSIWWDHFDGSYENFICNTDEDVDKRWEWLHTSMNPWYVTKTYHDQGYNAAMLDQAAIEKVGKDVAHTIACFIMDQSKCNDDVVIGLEDAVIEPPTIHQINDTDVNLDDLEKVFRYRDCFYATDSVLAESNRFHFLTDKNIATHCRTEERSFYEQFVDTDFLLNAIQSQKNCEPIDVDLPTLLADKDRFIAEKKLVVFVGPHETEAEAVTQFFAKYASSNNDDGQPNPSFNGWVWPEINPNIMSATNKEPYQIFDLLVTESDEDILSTVLDGIVDSWSMASKGVVIGSLWMDRVGVNPYTGYNALTALQRVVDILGINNEQVTIVVTYRTPPIDHWALVGSRHFQEKEYKDFVCSDTEASKRWEWLDTVMNPFMIAKSYHDEGWNVTVVDQEGSINTGTDVPHAIACDILTGVHCQDGWVQGLEDVKTTLTIVDIDSLGEDEQHTLNQLFLQRDCFYKYELKGKEGFNILNQHSTWSSCSEQNKMFYEQFVDTNFLLRAIQSQQGCAENNLDVDKMLENKVVQNENKLVIFAGPHETNGENVTQFFSRYASKDSSHYRSSFNGWDWPSVNSESIENEVNDYELFDLLISRDQTRPLQNILMDSIKDSWNNVQEGVILGSLYFDRVGKNPESNFDPIQAIQRIVDTLGIPDEDVTVVLTYRSPRIDHWSAVWKNHFKETQYKDFICSDTQSDKRWEWLDTVMSPMQVAHGYVEMGWNVVLIDYEGTTSAGKDVAHVLACDVMNGVDCNNDGRVYELETKTIGPLPAYEIDDLSDSQKTDLEHLFQLRECYYWHLLDSKQNFDTLYADESLWNSCPSSSNLEEYQDVSDTDFFLDAIRSQMDCGSKSVDLSKFLAGKRPTTTNHQQSAADRLAGLFISVAILAIIVTMMVVALALMKKKRRNAKSMHYPSEGVFRHAPPVVGNGSRQFSNASEFRSYMSGFYTDNNIHNTTTEEDDNVVDDDDVADDDVADYSNVVDGIILEDVDIVFI